MSLSQIESELKRRVSEYPYTPWGRKQADDWDRVTNFIYLAPSWANVRQITTDMEPGLRNYAINRWFNFWSAVGVERIFCELPGVKAAKNKRDRLVDFSIQGINFDHKTSVFPQGYEPGVEYAAAHPWHLAAWLYKHQSSEKRQHFANRLFLILYDDSGEHWKLRAELSMMRSVIEKYVAAFRPERLIKLSNPEVLTDIIWIPGREGQGANR